MLAAITNVLTIILHLPNLYNEISSGDPKIYLEDLPHTFDLLNDLKNLQNAELFRRKLKLFLLNRHSVVYMCFVCDKL